jgi:hypothetical protein
MTRTTLKTYFEDGDKPTGTDYANMIDSYLSLADSGDQEVSCRLNMATLAAGTLCATNLKVGGTLNVSGALIGPSPHFSLRHNEGQGKAASYRMVSGMTGDGTGSNAKYMSAPPVEGYASFIEKISGWVTDRAYKFTCASGKATYTGTCSAIFNVKGQIYVQTTADVICAWPTIAGFSVGVALNSGASYVECPLAPIFMLVTANTNISSFRYAFELPVTVKTNDFMQLSFKMPRIKPYIATGSAGTTESDSGPDTIMGRVRLIGTFLGTC